MLPMYSGVSVHLLWVSRHPRGTRSISPHFYTIGTWSLSRLTVHWGSICQYNMCRPRNTVHGHEPLVHRRTESFHSQSCFYQCRLLDLRRGTHYHPRCVKEWHMAEFFSGWNLSTSVSRNYRSKGVASQQQRPQDARTEVNKVIKRANNLQVIRRNSHDITEKEVALCVSWWWAVQRRYKGVTKALDKLSRTITCNRKSIDPNYRGWTLA